MAAAAQRGESARRAYAWIRRGIVAGELAPGSMLSENDLAGALGMSRTPVRTALGRLQDDGWVTIYPQRGALVRELTATEIRESAEVRHAMEVAGVLRASTERLAALHGPALENLDEQAAALGAGDFARFNELSLAFHRLFVRLSGNGTMLELYDRVQDRQLLSNAARAQGIVAAAEDVLAQHRRLQARAWASDWIGFAEALNNHHSIGAAIPAEGC
ncbi:MAG: GntR family transcriptional regulator [Micropruina sp.]|uniref:GntR family transcriptional regulator n=1 Tax=Micropruina sp. TaxID=2737536 RepID=UPI0039E31EC9